jgi:serine/threonine protein kinase/tetratricopeptide (TPR) repeat protein
LTSDRWEQVERVYHDALERPRGSREAFLEETCEGDPELLAEVRSLLSSHERADGFLETPAIHEAAAELANTPPALQPQQRVGHYDISMRLAVGGMGEVYLARDSDLHRDVAIKLLRDAMAGGTPPESLLREARAAALLSHPNICTVHEVGQFEGHPYLVMEYVQGRTLAEIIAGAAMPVDRVIAYGIAIADALAHAHGRGLLHKDLKSANVMVTEDDRIKVVDFGIAQRLDQTSVEALTRSGARLAETLAGTPAYMPPEVLRGAPANTRSDIWALGVLLYEMATGVRPFRGTTEFEIGAAILHEVPRPLPHDLPPAFRSVVNGCLAKDPASRSASAAQVRSALQAAAAVARPSTHALLGSRRARLAVCAAAAALALFIWWAVSWQHPAISPSEPSRSTLAILPFTLLNSPPGDQHLSISIADSVIARMAGLRSVRVRPTANILRYRDVEIDAVAVGRDLAAGQLLLGTFRTEENGYRVTVQVLETREGSVEWGEGFTVAKNELMAVEEQVAERVVRAFNLSLTADERGDLTRQYTRNPAAYVEYLKGRAALVERNPQSVEAAAAAFERAIDLDRGYVQAYAGLALATVRRSWYTTSAEEAANLRAQAAHAANRALELDPRLGEAHDALAAVYRYSEFEWDKTIEESRVALELDPNLDEPPYHMAVAFYHLGLFELSNAAALAGLAANPDSQYDADLNRGRAALYDGRFREACASSKRSRGRNRSRRVRRGCWRKRSTTLAITPGASVCCATSQEATETSFGRAPRPRSRRCWRRTVIERAPNGAFAS